MPIEVPGTENDGINAWVFLHRWHRTRKIEINRL